MKKIFINPNITITNFSGESIVTASNITENKTVLQAVNDGELQIDGKIRKVENVLAITF